MTARPTILVVEDDEILTASLMTRLALEGMTPVHAGSCRAALEVLARRRFDAVVSDIRLPDGSGEDVFWSEQTRFAMTPTIFATAYGDVEQAVRLVKLGATDYLTKPYDIGALVERLRRVTAEPAATATVDFVPSVAPAMQRVEDALERLADVGQNILFVGPSGSGRQTLARRLHARSARRDEPFVVVEGAALATPGGDRLLFGSLDGGVETPGLVDTAGQGTLLFVDVEDITAEVRPRLARFVESHGYRRVGSPVETIFPGRIMATSDPGREMPGVKSDLMRRFAVVELPVPPLCEREADVLPLAEHLLTSVAAKERRGEVPRLSPEAIAALRSHDWPGDIRELRNRVVRAVLLSRGPTLSVDDLFPDRDDGQSDLDHTLGAARKDAERQAIEAALAENHGRIVETAKALGISRVTLWSKMKQFGIGKRAQDASET